MSVNTYIGVSIKAHLYTSRKSRQSIRYAMRHQLPIHIEIIFPCRDTQRRYIDRNMQHAEEREREHGRYSVDKSGPIDSSEVYKSARIGDKANNSP